MSKFMIFLQTYAMTLRDQVEDLRNGDDRGAGMAEYALLVAFIALVAIVGITIFGTQLSAFFSSLADMLPGGGGGGNGGA